MRRVFLAGEASPFPESPSPLKAFFDDRDCIVNLNALRYPATANCIAVAFSTCLDASSTSKRTMSPS